MFGSETIRILFLVNFFLTGFAMVTGLLKLVFKKNEIIQLLHKMAGPTLAALFTVLFVLTSFSFCSLRPIPRILLIVLFVVVVYASSATGYRKDMPWVLLAHRILGILSFVMFTLLLFFIIMV